MNDRKLEAIKRRNERKNLDDVLRAITTFGITAIASTVLDDALPLYFGTISVGVQTLGGTYQLYKHYRYIKGAKDNLE